MIPLIIGLAIAGGAIGGFTGGMIAEDNYCDGVGDGEVAEKTKGVIKSGNAGENRLDDIIY